MNSENIKRLFSTSSTMVAAAAKLARKQAELSTLNNVTLPKLYYGIGKKSLGSATLPADLAPLCERIHQLEAALAAKPAAPKREPAVGFAAKAKDLAQRAAASTAKATADAASSMKLQAAYVALGKAALDKCGVASLPADMREHYETVMRKRDTLTGEIQTLQSTHRNKWITPARLAVLGGIACLLLGYMGLRRASTWVFGEPRQERAVKAPWAQSSGGSHTAAAASSAGSPREFSSTDTIVSAVLGPTSGHYNVFGYKDVRLGQSYKDVNDKRPLGWLRSDGPFRYHAEDREPGVFVFDSNDRLVSYEVSYEGGRQDYLPELLTLFGEECNALDTRTQRSSRAVSNYQCRRYAFPKTLVFVEFRDSRHLLSSSEGTTVVVLDRDYVERLLRDVVSKRRKPIQWIASAARSLKTGDVSASSLPSLSGCRLADFGSDVSSGVEAYDTQYENDPQAKALSIFGEKGRVAVVAKSAISDRHLEHQVQFDFRCLTSSIVDTRLKQSLVDGEESSPTFAIDHLQYVWMLKTELTAWMLHAQFPSQDGRIRFVQKEKDGVMPQEGAYAWEHKEADGDRWLIHCDENDMIQVVYRPRKKL